MFEISKIKRLIPVTEIVGRVSRTVYIDPLCIDSVLQVIDNGTVAGRYTVCTSAGVQITLDAAEFRRLLKGGAD